MKALLAVVDRTAVLFLGVAAGVAIGLAFGGGTPGAGPARIIVPPPPAPVAGPAAPAAAGGALPAPGGKAAPAAPRPAQTAQAAPEVSAVLAAAGPLQQQVFTTVQGDAAIRVGVFGDSFGDGVWSGLNRLLPRKDGFQVLKYSQQATGFTRYKSLNLETHAAEQLGEGPLDVAVISYGANDTQGVYTGNGHAAALLTPAWQAEIGARVERFVALLRRHGAQVYWVGLPRMRKTGFDADIQGMNAFYAAKMAQLGVPFIDTRPYASDASGDYAAYLPDPKDGHQVLIRADDGIHMSMNGYVWITRGLAQRIRAYVDAARRVTGGTAAAPVRVAAAASAPLPAPARAKSASPTEEARPGPVGTADRPRPPSDAADKPRPSPDKPKPSPDKPRPGGDKPKPAPAKPAEPLTLSPADLGEPDPPRTPKPDR